MPDSDQLKSSADRKQAAVKALEDDLQPGTKRAGAWADESTAAAVKELKGWDTALGLGDALKEWGEQVKALQNRLASEKTAHSTTNLNLQAEEHGNAARLSPLSPNALNLTSPLFTSKITDL